MKCRWCQDCTDLTLQTTFKELIITDGEEDSTDKSRQEYENLWKKLKRRFTWMKKLINLVILGDYHFEDHFMNQFLDWIREI